MGIKSLELDPTWENVYNTLVADAVGRNKNLWQFACFCSAQEGRCSISLDSGWGTGKSFFLKQLEMLFDAYSNQPERLNETDQKKIQELFNSYVHDDNLGMTIHPHTCIYYDAWLNDNAEDPMRSILYCLIKCKSEQFLKQSNSNEGIKNKAIIFANNVKAFAKRLCQFNPKNDLILDAIAPLETFIPLGLGKITESIKASNPTHEIEIQKSFHDAFDDFLKQLIPSTDTRLLILIDELDRCKPTYAVQLLERIKHYLSNDRITFVFAVNEEQLYSTIKTFYGEGFNAHQYLDRFFDHRFVLPQINLLRFRRFYGFLQADNETPPVYVDVCDSFLKTFPLSMREEIKYRSQVKLICDSVSKHRKFVNDPNWWLVLYAFFPFLLGLKISNKGMYNDFVNGKERKPFLPVISNCRRVSCLLVAPSQFRSSPEMFAYQEIDVAKAQINFNTVYQYLFVDQLREQTHVDSPPFFLEREMRDVLLSALGFMADFIKYDTNTEENAHG